jgi:hypothetical protein
MISPLTLAKKKIGNFQKDRVVLGFSNYKEKINMPYNIQHLEVS